MNIKTLRVHIIKKYGHYTHKGTIGVHLIVLYPYGYNRGKVYLRNHHKGKLKPLDMTKHPQYRCIFLKMTFKCDL